MARRKYTKSMLQRIYDHMIDNPPFYKDTGRRWGGASHRVCFWKGYDGLVLPNGRPPCVQQTQGWAAYMAGRDARAEGLSAPIIDGVRGYGLPFGERPDKRSC